MQMKPRQKKSQNNLPNVNINLSALKDQKDKERAVTPVKISLKNQMMPLQKVPL